MEDQYRKGQGLLMLGINMGQAAVQVTVQVMVSVMQVKYKQMVAACYWLWQVYQE